MRTKTFFMILGFTALAGCMPAREPNHGTCDEWDGNGNCIRWSNGVTLNGEKHQSSSGATLEAARLPAR